jgi:hypothetical protein
VPHRPTSFYLESAIDLRVATEVVRLHPGSREIASSGGQSIRYDRLLLLLPELSRFVTGSPGATRRTFILFVRLRIAVPSSDAHKRAQGNHSWCKFYQA